ncbi:MAG: two-component system response regulator [Frankiales bacterium]|jgi:CheY-like chemotaxis protein|nr:two-component system response regulator [Frankiales bacterium]
MSHAPAMPAAMAAAMAGLAVDAKSSLIAQVDAVEAVAVRALQSPVPVHDPERVDALRCAHRVAGTAGAFGWHEASALLREAEALLEADGPLDDDAAVALCELVETARGDLARPPSPGDGTIPQQQGPPAFAPLEPLATPPSAPDAQAATVDVVVVEDDLILGALLCQVVTDMGLSVQHCEDGVSALGLLAGAEPLARPRLVLLDIDLPGRSGLSVLRVLQRDRVTRSASVIMLSSRSGADDRELATELGATSFLSKPFAIRDVTDHLQLLVRSP